MNEDAPREARFSDYLELTKPRLSLLSVMTALVGYFAAKPAFEPLRIGFWRWGRRSRPAASPRSTSGWRATPTPG